LVRNYIPTGKPRGRKPRQQHLHEKGFTTEQLKGLKEKTQVIKAKLEESVNSAVAADGTALAAVKGGKLDAKQVVNTVLLNLHEGLFEGTNLYKLNRAPYKARLHLFLDLLEYEVPKLARTEVTGSIESRHTFVPVAEREEAPLALQKQPDGSYG
jgi:hypothetical protein